MEKILVASDELSDQEIPHVDIQSQMDKSSPASEDPELDDLIQRMSVLHIDILGQMDKPAPAFDEREVDELVQQIGMLSLRDDGDFVKDREVSTETPRDSDISTALDVIFPIDSSCDLDQPADVADGVGIVSTFSSVVIPTFHKFPSRILLVLDSRTRVIM